MRTIVQLQRWLWFALLVIGCFVGGKRGHAESALPLLGGFDAARIDAAYPPSDADATGELAKLIYRLQKIDRKVLETKVGPANQIGDVIRVDGKLQQIQSIAVPKSLVEFLELTQLQSLSIGSDQGVVQVVTAGLPAAAAVGDRVSGVAIVVEQVDQDEQSDLALAAARLSWFPVTTTDQGWQLLSEAGVDISLLAEVGSRSRMPLMAEDGEAFYAMLAAADRLAAQPELPPAPQVAPVTLLQPAAADQTLSGHWLTIELETVQITRVAVTDPQRQQQLGGDHYYQIDAMGDLGNVVVKIERPAGESGPPAIFENRYPVSVVVRQLPEFLRQRTRQSSGGEAIVAEVKVAIAVEGFFFRLWSYSTDFMNRHGGADQFGPLVVASRITNREPTAADTVGVTRIGWIAAVAVLAGLAATLWWQRRVTAGDDQVRRKRRDRESQQLQLPAEDSAHRAD